MDAHWGYCWGTQKGLHWGPCWGDQKDPYWGPCLGSQKDPHWGWCLVFLKDPHWVRLVLKNYLELEVASKNISLELVVGGIVFR